MQRNNSTEKIPIIFSSKQIEILNWEIEITNWFENWNGNEV